MCKCPPITRKTEHSDGVSIVNIGVGPSNAKNCTDHLAVLRPDAMLMVGHCAGVRNHQEIGDYVLASGYMRGDNAGRGPATFGSDHAQLPAESLPGQSTRGATVTLSCRSRVHHGRSKLGARLVLRGTLDNLQASRSVAVDMESATVAANEFRYRIPTATLLCVSDKPLHGMPKLPCAARSFYGETKQQHIAVAIAVLDLARWDSDGLPNSDILAPMNL